ncbi:unnamed protein product [Rhodiola kirilowii]
MDWSLVMKLQSMFLIIMVATTSFISSIAAYTPTDHFLVDCGSFEAATTSSDKRQWEGDENGNYFPPGNSPYASLSSTASFGSPQVPYRTARVFTAPFTYIFPLSSSGPKFLRLFFNPSTYSDGLLDMKNSYFSLLGNNYTLLNNFNAYLSGSGGNTPFFYKEFYINIPDSSLHSLNLTFNPNHNSYAFVNGIEIVSVPDALYRNEQVFYKDGNYFIQVVTNKTAMEVVYRLNVGGNDVSPNDDTGMFRSWGQDTNYLIGTAGLTPTLDLMNIIYTDATPNYTAPAKVYTSSRTMGREPTDNLKFNLTWVFQVHAGFTYLMRLHFCEISLDVVQDNYRVFSIYINGQLTWESMDVFREAGGRLIPIYRDFTVLIPYKDRKRRLVNLSLELHPYITYKTVFYDALLNGLEIFKVNDSDGSLAGANPDDFNRDLLLPPKKEGQKKKEGASVEVIVGCVVGGVLLGFLLLCFLIGRKKKDDADEEKYLDQVPGMPARFSYEELKIATEDFIKKLGEGGFGSVFEGKLSNGTHIAVKVLDGVGHIKKSFLAEVETIGSVHHFNLVTLIGFCAEKSHRALVYEYMPNGSLEKWIFKPKAENMLDWKQRRKIILDIAKGLSYLHEDCRRKIVHLDIKPQNILLDEKFNAKVSDFGLSKLIDKDQSNVMTQMRGTPGYLAPEWLNSVITEKVDVYSFGIVVLEILCGRKNLDRSQAEEEMHLLSLFKSKGEENLLLDLVDKCSEDMKVHSEEVVKMMSVAAWCVQSDFAKRPSMSVVVKVLEGVMDVDKSMDYTFVANTEYFKTSSKHDDSDGKYGTSTLLPSVLSGPR